jgi:DNA-binding response OmpR family regulator
MRRGGAGATALTSAREFVVDAAIVDVGLPDITGEEVARELRHRRPGRLVELVRSHVPWMGYVETKEYQD